jgi:predicted ATP-grasp superfamily ATP-dependent carboligase
MALLFPADGPWMESLRRPGTPWDLPAFADIPQPGETIEAGRPILTFFARADSVAACREKLGQIALELDNWLFAR